MSDDGYRYYTIDISDFLNVSSFGTYTPRLQAVIAHLNYLVGYKN